ncbi:MAG: hypothetical protein JWR80_9984 [Bradyrhizobium sp.]|nr:hypothetical protein [Bradyrhizobium sp.]
MISRRILAAVALLCAIAAPAQAQKTKAQITTEIGTLFFDNTSGQITPQGLRTVALDTINSIMPTAPVVSGNLACFSGTTGLLQDCGAAPNALIVGTTTIASGTTNGLLYNNAGTLGNIATAANGVLGTSAGGVPSVSTTLPSGLSIPAPTITGSFTATGLVTNAALANPSTTVNGQVCTLGSTCTISASAGSITVGTTNVASGTTTRVLYDNAGVLGEYSITGTGNVVMSAAPTLTGIPVLGAPTATSLALGGATIGANALAVTGTSLFNSGSTFGAAITYGGVTLSNAVTGTGNMVLSAGPTFTGTITASIGNFSSTLGSAAHTITSASASAFATGLNGATNPAFVVDSSTASQAAGLKVTGAATGGTVAVAAIDSGSNASLTVNAKGSGTIGIGTVSSGGVTITPALTLGVPLTVGNGGTGATTLSGALDSAFSSTQGAILYRNSSAWVALPPGTSGQFLTTQGAAANPNWSSGGAGTGTVTQVGCGSGLSGGTITASGTCASYFDPSSITNCKLEVTVSGNALTGALKTQSGATPSASSPCTISFPNATVATGDYTPVDVTAATTFSTGTSGSTFGSTNNVPFKLYWFAANNGGTVVLGAISASTPTRIYSLDDDLPKSTTACSACTNATSPGVYYTTSALTTKSIRVIGVSVWESGLATAGTWASAPTTIRMRKIGMLMPNQQTSNTNSFNCTAGANTTNATAAFVATAATTTITPSSAANFVSVTYAGEMGTTSAADSVITGVLRGGTLTGSEYNYYPGSTAGASAGVPVSRTVLDFPQATTSTTYAVGVRTSAAATTGKFGASSTAGYCTINVVEIVG